MSLRLSVAVDTGQRFPRVSGDEPFNHAGANFVRWFSPRERG